MDLPEYAIEAKGLVKTYIRPCAARRRCTR